MSTIKFRNPKTGVYEKVGVQPGPDHAHTHAIGGRDELTPEMIGAMKMDLLWENASPTSAFAEQTIALDLSKYDCVMVTARGYDDWDIEVDTFVSKGECGILAFSDALSLANHTIYVFFRTVRFNVDGLVFTGGGAKPVTNTTSGPGTEGKACIPHRIYGIKGVS